MFLPFHLPRTANDALDNNAPIMVTGRHRNQQASLGWVAFHVCRAQGKGTLET